MAYVVRRGSGSWEVRESVATSRGPRSRTLAGFRELEPETVGKALARASSPLGPEEVRRAALRAGAPVVGSGSLAGRLLGELDRGSPPAPGVRRLLLEALGSPPRESVTDTERAAAQWLDRSAEQRGQALWDLLRLGDALPARQRGPGPAFPRIVTGPA